MVDNKRYRAETDGEGRVFVYEIPMDKIATPNAVKSALVRPEIKNSDIQKGIEKMFGDKNA
jgi:hypothetical protein